MAYTFIFVEKIRMKKIGTLLILLVSLLPLEATIDTTSYWDYATRITHGSTNEVMGVTTDTIGNIYYSSYTSQLSTGFSHALAFGKMNDSGDYVWKKEFACYPDEPGHSLVTDGENLFVAGVFRSHLYLPKDTLNTGGISKYASFLISLDVSNGDVNWVKQFELKEDIKLDLDKNGDLVLSVATLNGDQIYDNTSLRTLSIPIYQRGYGFITINRMDGSVKEHAFGENLLFPNTKQSSLVNRKVYGLLLTTSMTWGPAELHLKILDLSSNTISGVKKVLFNSKNSYFDILNTVYIPKEKSWVVFVEHNNEDIYVDKDTLFKGPINGQYKITSAVKLDSNLKYLKHIRFVSALENEYQVINSENLLFTFGVNGDGFMNQDTILYKGINTTHHNGFIVAKCNFNLDSITYQRVSVQDGNAGWQTGMELRDLYLAESGKHYIAAFHENDIIMQPYEVKALNKSWKHLSVIGISGKHNEVLPTSLNELSGRSDVVVFPNPTNGILNIKSGSQISSIKVFDLQGRLKLHKDNSLEMKGVLNTSTLHSGIYLIAIESEDGMYYQKLIKQ